MEMKGKKLPELAIIYLQFGTALVCSWPLSSRATNFEKISREIRWWIFFILLSSVQIPMFYTVYSHRKNFMELTKFLCYSSACAHSLMKMAVCKRHQKLFQKLIEELEEFINNADSHEREVLDSCVRQAGTVHLTANIIGFLTAISVILGPIILDQILPLQAEYPFNINYYPMLQIIYISQAIIVAQCGAIGPLDGQVCILIWFVIARLKLLGIYMKNISSIDDLNHCVQIHQNLLRYLDDAFKVVRPIVGTTVATASFSIVFGGIHIVGNEPFSVKVQFVGMDISYSSVLFMSVFAAEMLMLAMNDVKWSLYESSWLENSKHLNKSISFVIQRLNKLPSIALAGFIPELSLNYWAVFLSKAMSFFTTLRVMIDKFDEKSTEI